MPLHDSCTERAPPLRPCPYRPAIPRLSRRMPSGMLRTAMRHEVAPHCRQSRKCGVNADQTTPHAVRYAKYSRCLPFNSPRHGTFFNYPLSPFPVSSGAGAALFYATEDAKPLYELCTLSGVCGISPLACINGESYYAVPLSAKEMVIHIYNSSCLLTPFQILMTCLFGILFVHSCRYLILLPGI